MKKSSCLGVFLTLAFLMNGCVVESHKTVVSHPTGDQNFTKSKVINTTDQVTGSYRGEFLALGIGQSESLINSIKSNNNETINSVLSSPNDFIPPVLYALADQIMEMNEPRAAMFWYYTAQLRARSDANKSLDPTVSEGLNELNRHYGLKIGRYAKEHIDELTEIMGRVIEYDKISERQYEPKWVAVLGAEAYTKDVISFVGSEEYDAINNSTRDGFYRGFLNAVHNHH
jgi:hypothetical protein